LLVTGECRSGVFDVLAEDDEPPDDEDGAADAGVAVAKPATTTATVVTGTSQRRIAREVPLRRR
jgi:hypothetical protein